MSAKPLLLAVLLSSFCPLLSAQELRTFTNKAGTSIQAKLVHVTDLQVTIEMADGKQFTLPIEEFSPADQTYLRNQPSSAATSPVTSSTFGNANQKNQQVSAEALNAAIGLNLFNDGDTIWNQNAEDIAKRLELKRESETKVSNSFRSYPRAETQIFGTRAYSIALYGQEGKTNNLSLVFANKGDLFGAGGSAEEHFKRGDAPEKAAQLLKQAIDQDRTKITQNLTKLLGEPTKQRFGDGEARRNMLRWDWRGHSFLLAEIEDEYIGIQIETDAFADSGGRIKRTPEAIVRSRVLENVEHRDNGDVFINDIPMVDQGPKGYCAPATAERAMRHLDVPADMYVLAMAAGAGFGGGASIHSLLSNVERDIKRKGRNFSHWKGDLKMREISRSIDRGIPILWTMYSISEFNSRANERTKMRKDVTNWDLYAAHLKTEVASTQWKADPSRSHVVLIVGYNKNTNEIAFSDSWGERYKERWITIPEAEQISQKHFWSVDF